MSDFFISLLYHNVCPAAWRTRADGPLGDLSTTVTNGFVDDSAFADQLSALARNSPCLRPDAMRGFYSGEPLPSSGPGGGPPVQITFDDGWRGSVDYAGPILQRYNWQATLFVTTGLIGKRLFLSRSELHRLNPATFLVGSHCHTHADLNRLPTDQVRAELQTSKADLESILGYEVDCVSIPEGAVDDRVRRIACDVGYNCVFTSSVQRNTRRHGPLSIGRVAVRQATTTAAVERFASGDLSAEQLRSGVMELPRRLLGPRTYRCVRDWLVQEPVSHSELSELVDRQ